MASILNIETATTNCSVSLSINGEVVASKEHDTPNYSHSEQLHLFIQEVLQKASVGIEEIDAVAVSKGPGSYTGLRIGVSAAKGLCFAQDIPLISVATLTSLAHQARHKGFDFVIPLLDARRMEVYSAVFDVNGLEVRETRAELIDTSSFCEFSEKNTVLLIGSGAQKCQDVLTGSTVSYHLDATPSANEMAGLSFEKYKNQDFEDCAYFEPYYLKDFFLQTKKKS